MNTQAIEISSRDYWFKAVEMLQQNWALIDAARSGSIVWFLDDLGGVFDRLEFASVVGAARALKLNGFHRFTDEPEARNFIVPPSPPFHHSQHPNGPIYSSGRFWNSAQ